MCFMWTFYIFLVNTSKENLSQIIVKSLITLVIFSPSFFQIYAMKFFMWWILLINRFDFGTQKLNISQRKTNFLSVYLKGIKKRCRYLKLIRKLLNLKVAKSIASSFQNVHAVFSTKSQEYGNIGCQVFKWWIQN